MRTVERLSIKEITRRTGHSRNTIRAALRCPEPPSYGPRTERPSKLDPHKAKIHELLRKDARIPSQVIRERITEAGYRGGKTILDDYVRDLRPIFAPPRTFQRTHYEPAEVRRDADWVAAYRIVPEEGRPVIGGVSLVPYSPNAAPGEWRGTTPAGGLPCELRAAVRTEATLSAVQEVVAWHLNGEWLPVASQGANRAFVEDVQRRFGFEPTRLDDRRRPHVASDVELARVAADYIRECEVNSQSPRKSLARRMGFSADGLSKKLSAARGRGILTSNGRGRPGAS